MDKEFKSIVVIGKSKRTGSVVENRTMERTKEEAKEHGCERNEGGYRLKGKKKINLKKKR